MKKPTYEEIFQRNIGVFTKEEQSKIRKLKIAIAGVGGLGGPVAYNFARLGVGEVRMADPDKFEASNLNRQSGAYIDTIGQYKVDAIANELKRINPFLKINSLAAKLDKNNIEDFLNGVDVVIDAIDFFSLDATILLHQKSREKNLWVFTCQGANNITSFMSFDPKGITIEEFLSNDGQKPSVAYAIEKMFPVLPIGANDRVVEGIISGSLRSGKYFIPSYSVISPFNGSFVTEEAVKVIIRKQKPVAVIPNFYFFDLSTMKSTFVAEKSKQ